MQFSGNDIDKELLFHEELDQLVFEQPNGSRIHFSDDQSILNLFRQQCPNWKDQGITSVPMARRPHFLLCGKQMTKEAQQKMKANLKGDEAEKNIYRLFIEECSSSSPGMIVIPNFSTDARFSTKGTKVEIDLIVIHPCRGIFLLNVKNRGQKSPSVNKIGETLERHIRLVQMLQTYHTDNSIVAVPTHSVICDFAKKVTKLQKLELKRGEMSVIETRITLGKNDLRQDMFGKTWKRIVEQTDVSPSFDDVQRYQIGMFIQTEAQFHTTKQEFLF